MQHRAHAGRRARHSEETKMAESEGAAPPARDYEVGYGRPPKATQFKPEQSGNPKGRKKGSKNLKSQFCDTLGEMVTITEGGKPRKVTRFTGAVLSLTTRLTKGDAKCADALQRLVRISTALLDPNEAQNDAVSADELASIKKL